MGDRIILHVDMDAFYAAVEQMDNPALRGRPVVVGADPKGGRGRGVVSAASYEARAFGIHSALPISKAFSLCPHAAFLPPRFHRYQELSSQVMDILKSFTPLVEQLSIDEAFLDCSGCEWLWGAPAEIGRKIKDAIQSQTGLTASAGVATNKSIAKIASELDKPDGLTVCPPGREREFLAPLPVKALWGAGKKTVEILHTMGLMTIGDVAACTRASLERILGKMGTHLWTLAQGIDDREISLEWERKSFSEETTFERDVDDEALIEHTLTHLADTLSRRMRRDGLRCKTISLKIRVEGFKTYTRSRTLDAAIDDTRTILDTALGHFRNFDREGRKVRLVGIAITGLREPGPESARQLTLFEESAGPPPDSPQSPGTDSLLDSMKSRFGDKVTRATLLKNTPD
ncbi:MAG: DNA polymerase IV [Spirochaetes bacterium]|nr:MAG: DNA polymerase IV [Spirochaetota bacterium]